MALLLFETDYMYAELACWHQGPETFLVPLHKKKYNVASYGMFTKYFTFKSLN